MTSDVVQRVYKFISLRTYRFVPLRVFEPLAHAKKSGFPHLKMLFKSIVALSAVAVAAGNSAYMKNVDGVVSCVQPKAVPHALATVQLANSFHSANGQGLSVSAIAKRRRPPKKHTHKISLFALGCFPLSLLPRSVFKPVTLSHAPSPRTP